ELNSGSILWDTLESRPLPGTDGAVGAFFWSPDSRSIGYATIQNKLRTVPVSGGPPQTVCELPVQWRGEAWGRDRAGKGVIIFGVEGSGLMQVSEAGGTPTPLTLKDQARDQRHMAPVFLPDQRHFLYYRDPTFSNRSSAGIYVGSLDATPEQQSSQLLVASDSGPRYVPLGDSPVGRLLFLRESPLLAQPFDSS